MNKRKILIVITAVILTSILSGSLGAVTVLAWPFGDVNPGDWFYNDVLWLDSNNITHGCSGSNYCPNAYVTRAEMAAFLHREAGALVAAGAHIMRGGSNNPYVADWFNNYNGVAPTVSGSNGSYSVDFGFTTTNRFPLCSIDQNYVDTRNALCNVETSGTSIWVDIWDGNVGYGQPAEFYVLVIGQ